jgi:hypothetical protein
VTPGRKPYATVRVAAGAVAAAGVSAVTAAAFGFDTFVFAWVVQFALMGWMSSAVHLLRPRLDGPWFRVRSWEPAVYRRLGVWSFMRALRRLGWERAMRGSRAFDGTRASLDGLDRDTRTSEFGHLMLALAGTALMVAAAAVQAWSAFTWLAVLNVVLHGYPVLLQRAMRHRVGRVRTTP